MAAWDCLDVVFGGVWFALVLGAVCAMRELGLAVARPTGGLVALASLGQQLVSLSIDSGYMIVDESRAMGVIAGESRAR